MRILSPYDVVNLWEEMREGEWRRYYRGLITDDIESKDYEVALLVWKLKTMVGILVDNGYAETSMKNIADHRFNYYICKLTTGFVPERIIKKAEVLENRKRMIDPQ